MIKIIIALALMQSMAAHAEVIHHIRFCAGKFCAASASSPLSLSLQLELNKRFRDGSLIAAPTAHSSESNGQSKQAPLAQNTLQQDFFFE